MARYVTLITFTERGVKDIKDSGKRADEFKSHAKKHGIDVKEQLWCLALTTASSSSMHRMMKQQAQPCCR